MIVWNSGQTKFVVNPAEAHVETTDEGVYDLFAGGLRVTSYSNPKFALMELRRLAMNIVNRVAEFHPYPEEVLEKAEKA